MQWASFRSLLTGKCIQEVPIMSLLMPEQETDPQVDEPTSIQSLAIISEFLFNYERWCANDEILLSDQLEEPQLEEKWRLGLSQVQAFVSIMWLCLISSFWEINSGSPVLGGCEMWFSFGGCQSCSPRPEFFMGLEYHALNFYIIEILTSKHKATSGAGEDICKAVPEYFS